MRIVGHRREMLKPGMVSLEKQTSNGSQDTGSGEGSGLASTSGGDGSGVLRGDGSDTASRGNGGAGSNSRVGVVGGRGRDGRVDGSLSGVLGGGSTADLVSTRQLLIYSSLSYQVEQITDEVV